MTVAQKRNLHPTPSEPALQGDRRRIAFVSGAARGIGRAVAIRLARDGLHVAVNDLDDVPELQSCKAEIEALGAKCIALVGDVSDETRVEEMVSETVEALGYLDVMVANAGVAYNRPILDMTAEQLDKILRINVRSVHLCYKFAAKQMIRQGTGGKLIAASSLNGFKSGQLLSAYVARKFAVRGYNQTAALEFARYGITANCYAPGFVATRLTIMSPSESDSADKKARLKAGQDFVNGLVSSIPMKRMGEPEDVANLVSFLASRGSDYITGQAFLVSGGLHML